MTCVLSLSTPTVCPVTPCREREGDDKWVAEETGGNGCGWVGVKSRKLFSEKKNMQIHSNQLIGCNMSPYESVGFKVLQQHQNTISNSDFPYDEYGTMCLQNSPSRWDTLSHRVVASPPLPVPPPPTSP